MWKEMVRRSRAFIDDSTVATTGRVLEVRYEQLGREPEKVRNAVAEHLGVEAQGDFLALRTAHVNSVASLRSEMGRDPRGGTDRPGGARALRLSLTAAGATIDRLEQRASQECRETETAW